MRIAIAGGTGTLGRPRAAELIERGHQVSCSAGTRPSTRWITLLGPGSLSRSTAAKSLSTPATGRRGLRRRRWWRVTGGCSTPAGRPASSTTSACPSSAATGCPSGITRSRPSRKTSWRADRCRGPSSAPPSSTLVAVFETAARHQVLPAARGAAAGSGRRSGARSRRPRRRRAAARPGSAAGPEVVPIGERADLAAGRWPTAAHARCRSPGRVRPRAARGWLTAARPDVRELGHVRDVVFQLRGSDSTL